MSQIERGKTRPKPETIAWLASRLGVDAAQLENGVSIDLRARLEAEVAQAEALIGRSEFEEALQVLRTAAGDFPDCGVDDLKLQALSSEARCLVLQGDARQALALLIRARALSEGTVFTDIDRARVLFQIGVCRYQLSSVSTAIALFSQALSLVESSSLTDDILRSNILGWRSRCYRRQRDLEGAREDVECAIELAEAINDPRRLADSLFNASLVAERSGHLIQARKYAERAATHYESLSDRLHVGKLQNNLGGLHFLLGQDDEAVRHLKTAVATAVDLGSDADAAQAISSLAQVHLRAGDFSLAESHARHALKLLAHRDDFLDETGSARLVLGRALLEQGLLDEADREFLAADNAFEQFGSLSHRARVWVARGDVCTRRHQHDAAAGLFRKAAEALQDVRF